MIPNFDARGYLPPGIHVASLAELISRFGGGSELRRIQTESIQWLVPLCRAAGVARLIINGSFVTVVDEPNDVDCVLLQGPGYNEQSEAAVDLEQGLPFVSLQIVRRAAFEYLVNSFFATDRGGMAKGVVEIPL